MTVNNDTPIPDHKGAHSTIASLDTISKVTPKVSWGIKQWMTWGTVGVVGIVLLVGLLFRPKQEASRQDTTKAMMNNYQEELRGNLEAIKRLKTEVSAVSAHENKTLASKQGEPTPEDIERQHMLRASQQQAQADELRAYQMRVNAPTSLLSSGSSRTSNTESSSQGRNNAVVSGQGANQNFMNQSTGVETVSATKLSHPDFTVASGELIQAVLETPINSDLPGMLRAITSQPVYAYTGNIVIIPAGSRLIGQYSSGIVQGQSRILVVWNRVILPDGTSAQVNSPGTDSQGISGQGADSINRHFGARFGEASLLSIIGAGAANVGVSGSSEYNSSAAYRSAVAQSFSDAANESLGSTASMQPTLVVHQGAKINVFVARDLDFSWALREKP